jgi:Mrp family chromosome partitioning ATPase
MAEVCRFDDSLPRLVKLLVDKLGRERVSAGVVLRDATGRLSFFSDAALEPTTAREIEQLAGAALGVYARPERVVVGATDPGAERVRNDRGSLDVAVRVDGSDDAVPIRYLDRRIVGTDWLRLPAESQNPGDGGAAEGESANAQRVVFASLKGGVGRSTALTVVAAEQARRGRNVLVIDLDLEAPGIGSLLLSGDRTPSFGVIDYLVERNFGTVDHAIVDDMIGTSALTQGQGLVSVVPAVGSRTLGAPGNYLAKLARAMIEAVDDDNGPLSLAGKLLEMLTALEAQRHYDLVLIDARAGLAEVTAGPLLALDAEILIFATDQVQTLQDLEFLFAHLASLTGAVRPAHWDRLKMVHAKAAQAVRINDFRDALWNLFSTHLYVETLELEEFNFDADAPEAPHYPLVIPLDTAFADWDPVSNPDKLVESYYARTFEKLIAYVGDLISVEQRDVQD